MPEITKNNNAERIFLKHIYVPTPGEKPYTCTDPGCDRSFSLNHILTDIYVFIPAKNHLHACNVISHAIIQEI